MPAGSLPDFPANLLEFQRMFADEAACLRYLERVRWPLGFTCAACGHVGEASRVAKRPRVLRCRACGVETTTTAGTIMHKTRSSLHVWFWAAYLVATTTAGLSALEMMKKLGVARYETAFQILHKLRAGMVRPDRDKIGGEWPVELDVIYVGGKHKGGRQGLTKQTPVASARVRSSMRRRARWRRSGTPGAFACRSFQARVRPVSPRSSMSRSRPGL